MKSPLTYKISVPTADSAEKKSYPTLFVLHGIGSNEENALALVEQLKDEFILISIRGFHDREDGYSHYEIQGFGNPNRESFDESVDRLQKTLAYCRKRYAIDPKFQYILGFSQGAALAMTLALREGNRIKGIIALSGYLPPFVKEDDQHESIDQVSVYISHGSYDPLFTMSQAKQNAQFFQNHRARNVRFSSFFARHEITAENEQDYLQWLFDDLKQV
ncbi:hypothetical protein BEP19_16345 [Ammoniphilus oxalaticus]|uniref:Phospholipase/carboxylesterase/thioesterase domain-containing protein n=1 Tax=Ammoniphilus oxalaticus TaxID=66863 RepID=A0A419SQN6_9BACL|nr:alpha/beta fold hydrolase [Ammoniphilus oxalaticus]RKD26769.1 hypothetical protein BEP19_16345 [Ammoniphilus oxalaticus]